MQEGIRIEYSKMKHEAGGSTLLAAFVRTSHVERLKGFKTNGSARRDTDVRNFKDLEHKFKDRWELLDI